MDLLVICDDINPSQKPCRIVKVPLCSFSGPSSHPSKTLQTPLLYPSKGNLKGSPMDPLKEPLQEPPMDPSKKSP